MQNRIGQKENMAISNLIFINGDIKAEEDLIVDGKVKGNVQIKNHSFLLGPSGRLMGNIYGQNVKIRGHMKGEIKAAGKVEITREAKFSGKIKCKSIYVEKGAYFQADVDLNRKSPEKGSLEETSSVEKRSERS